MGGFHRKAKGEATGGNFDSEAYNEWNKYIFECFKAKEKERPNGSKRKEKTAVGKVNFIMDLGYPPSKDNEWDTKCAVPADGEDYSQEEIECMKEKPYADFIWTRDWDDTAKSMKRVRKQTSPSQPMQEYGVCIDFGSVLVDYSKHPNSQTETEDLRPYRVSLNGLFNGEIQRPITFEANYKTGAVSDKNIIYKICAAAGLEKELIDSDFDIGTVAEAMCNFTLRMDLTEKDGRVFLNDSVSKPVPVEDLEFDGEVVATVEKQLEKASDAPFAPFVGILLEGMDYTEDMFQLIGSDRYGFVKRAETSIKYQPSPDNHPDFWKGINKLGEDGELVWDEKTNKPVVLDYDETAFAKAYEAWKKKNGKSESPTSKQKEASKPVEKPKEESKPEKVSYNEPPMDFDDK